MPALLNGPMSGVVVDVRGTAASVSSRAIVRCCTPERSASSSCVHPSSARAARHCAELIQEFIRHHRVRVSSCDILLLLVSSCRTTVEHALRNDKTADLDSFSVPRTTSRARCGTRWQP